MLDMYSPGTGILMLAMLFIAFTAMTKYNVPQALAMPLVACACLSLQGLRAEEIARAGFSHFSDIAFAFTAVAIPAHIIDRSKGFQWFAARAGRQLGILALRRPRLLVPVMIGVMLLTTYVLAGAMHNVTSILIMTPIIIRVCMKYDVPSRWILSAALVASNLGGFSTKWGDTPNIVESEVWHLTAADFTREVLPANLIVLLVLTVASFELTRRTLKRRAAKASAADDDAELLRIAVRASEYGSEVVDTAVDRRLFAVGLAGLAFFITAQLRAPQWHTAVAAATILGVVALERPKERLHTLKSLGYDVYLVFVSIFVLAGCVEASWIGVTLQGFVGATKAAPWSIALSGALGTAFTEAASWATAAAARIYPLDGSHTAAWALGAGICAGSSALITAASAGIILAEESARFKDPEHAITFRRYLAFGLPFSIFMLVFYSIYFYILRY